MNEQDLAEQLPVLVGENISKTYVEAGQALTILNHISLKIWPGERIAIVGPSGSGKTTLLHILGGLAEPSSGQVFIDQHRMDHIPETIKCQIRNQKLGFVYQFHHMLKELTALENVMMPLLIAKKNYKVARDLAMQILKDIGLEHRAYFNASRLSGGEKQRVAVARAIVHRPLCVLADEPTGNLDKQHASQVWDYLLTLQQNYKSALVLVTHDLALTKTMDRVYQMQEGALVLIEGLVKA